MSGLCLEPLLMKDSRNRKITRLSTARCNLSIYIGFLYLSEPNYLSGCKL
jgi:hypothetical protein